MPTPQAQGKAAELQRQLATLTGHQRARVKPYGKHLLIQMHSDGGDVSVDTIARLIDSRVTPTQPHSAATPDDGSPCPAPETSLRSLTWSSLCLALTSSQSHKPICGMLY